MLAYEDISGDMETSKRLDESQRRQLDLDKTKAGRELKEVVWRTYKNVERLVKDNTLQGIDLGLVHSSSAGSLTELIINRLTSQDEITQAVGPAKLVKYWPPASADIKPKEPVKFSASGYDQHGGPLAVTTVSWSATGGTIDHEGRFSADEIGIYRVEVRADSIAATAEA